MLLLAVLATAVGTKWTVDRGSANGPEQAQGAAPVAAASANGSAGESASAPVRASTPALASAVDANEPKWGQPGLAAERVGRAASAALATARAVAGLAPQPPAQVVLDLCGVGRLTMPRPEARGSEPQNAKSFETLPEPLGLWARAEAWPRVLAAMETKDRPERTRAAAQVLRATGLLNAEARPGLKPPAPPAEIAQATRSLARLARRTKDATVLHWALAVCEREAQPTADCKRLSPRTLTRIAPDEAQSWLAWAQVPGLPAAEQTAAMEKAAQAPRLGGESFQVAHAIDMAWPANLLEYLRLELLVMAVGFDHAMPPLWLNPVDRLCTAATLAGAQRQRQCDAIGRTLQGSSGSLHALRTAADMGQRLGWPEAEVQALTAQHAALMDSAAMLMGTDQPYACQAVENTRQWLTDAANLGEVQALRLRAATQPMTPRPAASKP